MSAFKLFFSNIYTVGNICRDKDYEIKEYESFVYPADSNVNQDFGSVTLLEVYDPKRDVTDTYVDETNIHLLSKEFAKKIPLAVAKSCEVQLRLKFNAWSKAGDKLDYYDSQYINLTRCSRFVQKPVVILKNNFEKEIKFTIFTFHKENNTVTLHYNDVLFPSKEEKPFTIKMSLFPEDEVRVFLHKPT